MDEDWIIASAITHFYSPTHERCDDDAPGCAATVGARLFLIFAPPAAQANGIEEEEK